MRSETLPELDELERILEAGEAFFQVSVPCASPAGDPVWTACLGTSDPQAPAVGFFGGVHGLERVGTNVLLAFMGHLVARLHWDQALHRQLRAVRLAFMPLVNPAGMRARRRSNANGVDLMRNAPVECREGAAFLVGGQRLSRGLPWYRGDAGADMEPESCALCEFVRCEMLPRPFSLAVDCHSGFGMRDRLWFPHAHTREPFARLAEVHALGERFARQHPDHAYLIEPQSRQYLAHGDLWDHLSLDPLARERIFLPLTLEMGSWRWVRKNPRQLLSIVGLYNPGPEDRLERVKRNHLLLFDFLARATEAFREWVPSGDARDAHHGAALASWFRRTA